MKYMITSKKTKSSIEFGGTKEKEMTSYIYTHTTGKLTKATAPLERYFILLYDNDADISNPEAAYKVTQKSYYHATDFAALLEEELMEDNIIVIRKLAAVTG